LTALLNKGALEAGPTAPADVRIRSLDAVRGLALFGVLAINLDSEFRVTLFEQFLPVAVASAPAVDRLVAALLTFFVEFKAFAIFSLLYGVGLAMQFDRLPETVRFRVLVRRLFVLLLFGVIHLTIIWNGDILTEYAIAGLLVLPLVGCSRRVLAMAAGAAMLVYLAMPWVPLPFSFPSPDWINDHVISARAAYSAGSFGEVLSFRIAELPQIAKLHIYVFPRTVALILLGALIWRSGALRSGAGGRASILRAGAVSVGVGALLSFMATPGGWGFGAIGWMETASANIAPVFLALGYAALIWTVSSSRLRLLVNWAAPAGQMAFTNYIMQSVVLGLLFYGYGAGLMGQVGVSAGLGISAALFIAQVFVSSRWLQSHRYGPLEWAWRSLTYGSAQPWQRPTSKGALPI
jgi:uncharacterized protein